MFCSLRSIQMSTLLKLFQKKLIFDHLYTYFKWPQFTLKIGPLSKFFFYGFRTFQFGFIVLCVVFKCQYFWSYSSLFSYIFKMQLKGHNSIKLLIFRWNTIVIICQTCVDKVYKLDLLWIEMVFDDKFPPKSLNSIGHL